MSNEELDSLERRVVALEEKLEQLPISADDVQAFQKVANALASLLERFAEGGRDPLPLDDEDIIRR